jgi:hypothetical protein
MVLLMPQEETRQCVRIVELPLLRFGDGMSWVQRFVTRVACFLNFMDERDR